MVSKPIAPLVRLASIWPPPLHLLVLSHARAQLDIHPWWGRESETLCHLHQIELVHVKHTSQAVACVRVQVRPVTFLGGLVEVVVLADELLELGLDVVNLGGGELELDDGYARRFQVGEEANF